jgi:hypothetical protein
MAQVGGQQGKLGVDDVNIVVVPVDQGMDGETVAVMRNSA